jgi:hypothetical protein
MSSRAILIAAALPLILAGCGADMSRTFGLTRDSPDEFTVTTRAPLSMPGASRPQELTAQQSAEAALAPDTALSSNAGPDTAGQNALVAAAGPTPPEDIRDKVNAEAHLDRPSQGLTQRLMFWTASPPAGTLLDPAKESARLREDAALGQPPTVGDTPVIQQKKTSSGFLGIF